MRARNPGGGHGMRAREAVSGWASVHGVFFRMRAFGSVTVLDYGSRWRFGDAGSARGSRVRDSRFRWPCVRPGSGARKRDMGPRPAPGFDAKIFQNFLKISWATKGSGHRMRAPQLELQHGHRKRGLPANGIRTRYPAGGRRKLGSRTG